MVIIIEGQELSRIQGEINRHCRKDQQQVFFDFEVNFEEFLNQIQQYNLFSLAGNVYVLKNSNFLGEANTFKEMYTFLKKWLPIWEVDSNTYFLVTKKMLANQKIRTLTENIQVITLEKVNDKNREEIVKTMVRQLKIPLTDHEINSLVRWFPNDYSWIQTELEKISNYTHFDNLTEIVYQNVTDDLFLLWNAVLQQNIFEMLRVWNNVMKWDNPIQTLVLLSAQMINSYFIKRELDTGTEDKKIIENYKINPYFFQIQKTNLKNWSSQTIKTLIDDLFRLEITVKENNLDSQNLFLFFFLSRFFPNKLKF